MKEEEGDNKFIMFWPILFPMAIIIYSYLAIGVLLLNVKKRYLKITTEL
jgi:hypothetical protein